MLKNILRRSNNIISSYNNSESASIWSFIHRWNYEHSLVKNLLQISNNSMNLINQYHVFRWEWMVGVLGLLAGFVVNSLE